MQRAALLLVLAAALAACRANPAPATVTPGLGQPTFTPAPAASPTPAASATQAPTPTAAEAATATQTAVVAGTAGTPGATLEPTAAVTAAPGTDAAEFLADVTIPDGMDLAPGEVFTKTWQVRNSGSTTWNAAYALAFVSGERMGGVDAVPLLASVAPGQSVDLSVTLTAPTALGRYTGFWMLRNASGQVFGIGPEANQPIYVQIDVVPAGAGGSPVPTGQAGPITVTAAQLGVDNANVTGVCPRTLVFSGSFTSQGAGQVSYVLEMAAAAPGFVFIPPDTNTSTFEGPGPRTFNVAYNMQFTGSVSGEMWLKILAPNALESNRVPFSLTCAP
jgi:hypothetical protein